MKYELFRNKHASWNEQMERLPHQILPTLDIGGGNSSLIFRIPGTVTMNLKKTSPAKRDRDAFMYDDPRPDITGDASKKIPLPDRSVGRVTMHHTIGHTDDPHAQTFSMSGVITPEQMLSAATEIHRVLVDGGSLYIYSGHLEEPLAISLYLKPLKAAGFSDIDYATSKHNIDDSFNKEIIYEESLYEEIGGNQGAPRTSFGGLIVATK